MPASFKTGFAPLAAESAEPDARLFHKPAVAEPENALAEANPENVTDLPEVFIHVFIPVAVSMMLMVTDRSTSGLSVRPHYRTGLMLGRE